jgi:hypothetical protein
MDGFQLTKSVRFGNLVIKPNEEERLQEYLGTLSEKDQDSLAARLEKTGSFRGQFGRILPPRGVKPAPQPPPVGYLPPVGDTPVVFRTQGSSLPPNASPEVIQGMAEGARGVSGLAVAPLDSEQGINVLANDVPATIPPGAVMAGGEQVSPTEPIRNEQVEIPPPPPVAEALGEEEDEDDDIVDPPPAPAPARTTRRKAS